VVQWLRICSPEAGDTGLIPGQGTRSHMSQRKITSAATKSQHSQINIKKKNSDTPILPNPGLRCISSHYLFLTPSLRPPSFPTPATLDILSPTACICHVTESLPLTRTCSSASTALTTSNSSAILRILCSVFPKASQCSFTRISSKSTHITQPHRSPVFPSCAFAPAVPATRTTSQHAPSVTSTPPLKVQIKFSFSNEALAGHSNPKSTLVPLNTDSAQSWPPPSQVVSEILSCVTLYLLPMGWFCTFN